MNLLGSVLYDPSSAGTKATSSLLAMTALDTTNLRLTVTVPAHGKLRFHMRGAVTGATTVPTLLIGVMVASVVKGRVAPTYENATANATTQNFVFDADFTVTGLAAGSTVFDAAYAVQVVVASTNIKFGGPDNNSGANAWGGFLFEIWDPQALPTASPAAVGGLLTAPTTANVGTADVVRWNGTTVATPATGGIPDINVKNMNNVAATAITTIKAVQGLAVDGVVTTVTNQLTAAQVATGVWQDATAGDFTAANSVGKSLMNGVALGTGLTINGYTGNTPQTGDAFARVGAAGAGLTALGDTRIANLDATVSSRTKPADTQAAVTTTTNLTNLPSIPTNWLTAAGIAASALNGKGDWNIGKTGYALSAAGVQAVWDALTSALTTVGSIGKLLVTNIDALISSRSTYAGGAVASVTGAVASVTAGVTVATNNDKTGYALTAAYDPAKTASQAGDAMTLTTGERTSIGTAVWASATRTLSNYGTLVADIATAVWGATVRTLSTFAFTVDTNANATETAIKAKTDSLAFTKTGEIDANIRSVAGTGVKGTGTSNDPWGPA